MLHALAPTGARILVIERGDTVPREDRNWDPVAVWKDLRYRTTEHWFDEHGEPFVPYMHYGVGGNTKFWGSVLYRLRREDFGALDHLDGVSPAWPIDYDTLEPYYDRAERSYRRPRRGRRGPDRSAARPVSASARAARARYAAPGRGDAPHGPSPGAAAARPAQARRPGRVRPLQHVQLVPMPDSGRRAMRKCAVSSPRSPTGTSRCGLARLRGVC